MQMQSYQQLFCSCPQDVVFFSILVLPGKLGPVIVLEAGDNHVGSPFQTEFVQNIVSTAASSINVLTSAVAGSRSTRIVARPSI